MALGVTVFAIASNKEFIQDAIMTILTSLKNINKKR